MIEYKLREVKRYAVTRWEDNGGSTFHGEYENGDLAYAVAYALAKTEADKLGLAPGDETMRYPELPAGVTGEGVRY